MTLITIRKLTRALWKTLVLLTVLCTSAYAEHTTVTQEQSSICVVIRTYAGHGGQSQQGLLNLIRSLQRQQNQKYVFWPYQAGSIGKV